LHQDPKAYCGWIYCCGSDL